ncbi:MAG TPA: tetratricopeptide repeat protein [Bryobacteraceae bacterium]|nr:tetratricopeptide repeat protein [Bryobacteraceae bacterium]
MRRSAWTAVAASLLLFGAARGQQSAVCAGCHPGEAAAYARTGMGRSFALPAPGNSSATSSAFYHQASDTYFAMVQRGGEYFQRQYQIGFDGKQVNLTEKRVDYVLGSGNHSRTFLSRTGKNALIELPLAWYAEKGGSWGMNPGYDSPDHQGMRRKIGNDCVFCHDAYPAVSETAGGHGADALFPAAMPEGIDCQRCHGAGDRHVELARRPEVSRADVRASIVNPARLQPARQAEVCLQCHLETTSSPLPNSMVRYERGPFSYQAGEPLADFKLFFDRAPDKNEDRFEIAGSAYRLGMSECALKSNGKLTCTTCHNPHDLKKGEEGVAHYTAVCRECHAADFNALVAAKKHTASNDCTGCHMPKRRTDDVVHVVMTDHYIQRRKPTRDLLAEMPERVEKYRSEVIRYRPSEPAHQDDELYIAAAQVLESSNLHPGIERLSEAIGKLRPDRAEPYLELADALRTDGKCEQALPVYDEARKRDPKSLAAIQRMALCVKAPVDLLRGALTLEPDDAAIWTQLGLAYLAERKTPDAIAALQKAVEIDPELPEAWNNLGGIWMQTGEPAKAENALRKAIKAQPNYAEAHNNLGGLLSYNGHFDEAKYHFEAALRYKPDYNFARFNYGIALARVNRSGEAEAQFEAILKSDPKAADTHEALGIVLASSGQMSRAVEHFREAVRIQPEFGRANLSLGSALLDSGDVAGAIPYLQKAASGTDAAVAREARDLLRKAQK